MRSIQQIVAEMEKYFAERKNKGVDESYLARLKHFDQLSLLLKTHKYDLLKKHLDDGIQQFTKVSLFKQQYLSYLKELKSNLYSPAGADKHVLQTKLYDAIKRRDIVAIKGILNEGGGAVLNEKMTFTKDKETPLQAALDTTDRLVILFLLQETMLRYNLMVVLMQINNWKGQTSEYKNNPTIISDYTLLHFAARYNLKNIVDEMLRKDIDCNIRNSEGKTPLFYACLYGHEEVVSSLLAANATINTNNNDKKYGSALSAAVHAQNLNIVKKLLNAGAKIDEVALGLAKQNQDSHPEIYAELKRKFREKKESVLAKKDYSAEWIEKHKNKLPVEFITLVSHFYFEKKAKANQFLDKLWEEYNESPSLRPIFDMLALGAYGKHGKSQIPQGKPLKIVVADRETVEEFTPEGERGLGIYKGKSTLYIGSGFAGYFMATLMHEAKHYCDSELFGTADLGFSSVYQTQFQAIFDEVQNNLSHIKINNPQGIRKILVSSFAAVFSAQYPEKVKLGELLARVPEALGALGEVEGSKWLELNVPNLFKFYKQQYLPICEQYVKNNLPQQDVSLDTTPIA